MKEVSGSIWIHFLVPGHFICVTTNGTVTKSGAGVMGRGNAKEATEMMPGIAKSLGAYLKVHGNVAGYLTSDSGIIIFPVKQHWWMDADLDLISRSARWLDAEAHLFPDNTYHLPRPGCGNGRRDWEREVRPIVKNMPDNVWIHHLPEKNLEVDSRSQQKRIAHLKDE